MIRKQCHATSRESDAKLEARFTGLTIAADARD